MEWKSKYIKYNNKLPSKIFQQDPNNSEEQQLYFKFHNNLPLFNKKPHKCQWCNTNNIYNVLDQTICNIINKYVPSYNIYDTLEYMKYSLRVNTFNKKIKKVNKSFNHVYYFQLKIDKYILSNIYSYLQTDIFKDTINYVLNILGPTQFCYDFYKIPYQSLLSQSVSCQSYNYYKKPILNTWKLHKIHLYCNSCKYNENQITKCQFCGLDEYLNINGICEECWYDVFDKKEQVTIS